MQIEDNEFERTEWPEMAAASDPTHIPVKPPPEYRRHHHGLWADG